ncbi:hypothetical protein V2G26_012173 [Clonostachys chloroleuca]
MDDIQNKPGYHDNRGQAFQAYVVTLFVMAALATILRFWSRSLHSSQGKHGHRFWWDDWMALASLCALTAQTMIIVALVSNGLGRHLWALDGTQITTILKLLYAVYYVYDLCLTLTRACALFFFTRIFPSYGKWDWFSICVWVTHGLNIGWFVGIVIGTIVRCHPIAKNWIPTLDGYCGPNNSFYVGSAVPSVSIDLIILILPLPKVWALHTSAAKKIGICVVFALGYGVIVASLGRLVTVFTEADALNNDITNEGMNVFFWTCAEGPISVLCMNLPAMLRLSNHLGTAYFSPLASKVQSLLSRSGNNSTLRSRSGNFAQSKDGSHFRSREDHQASQLDNPSTGDLEYGHRSSGDSKKNMLAMERLDQPQYSTHVRSNVTDAIEGFSHLPTDSIRVDNSIRIERR